MVNGREIRSRREALGLTQAQASATCGWRRATLWNEVETGLRPQITAVTLYRIARVLGCSMDELMDRQLPPTRRGGSKRRRRVRGKAKTAT